MVEGLGRSCRAMTCLLASLRVLTHVEQPLATHTPTVNGKDTVGDNNCQPAKSAKKERLGVGTRLLPGWVRWPLLTDMSNFQANLFWNSEI